MAAACGDDDDGGTAQPAGGGGTTTTGTGAGADLDVDPDGVVKLAMDLASASQGGSKWDPSAFASQGASQLGQMHYGGLMRKNAQGELVPDLAESAEAVDANTIEVVMREGLTLSDGKPLDAAMVKAAIDPNFAKGQIPAFRPGFFSLKTVALTDPTP